MNGTVPIIQVVFGGLLAVGLVAVLGLMCSLLCLHALGGVKTRMVTSEKLGVFKAEFERFFEHKLNNGLGDQSRAIDELRDELTARNEAVASIQTSNTALVKQMDLMSHNLLRVHEKHVDRLLDQLNEARKLNPALPVTILDAPSLSPA